MFPAARHKRLYIFPLSVFLVWVFFYRRYPQKKKIDSSRPAMEDTQINPFFNSVLHYMWHLQRTVVSLFFFFFLTVSSCTVNDGRPWRTCPGIHSVVFTIQKRNCIKGPQFRFIAANFRFPITVNCSIKSTCGQQHKKCLLLTTGSVNGSSEYRIEIVMSGQMAADFFLPWFVSRRKSARQQWGTRRCGGLARTRWCWQKRRSCCSATTEPNN